MQSLTFHLSIAPGDYGALTGFSLGPFNDSVRQLTFSVSIVNDVIPEDDETFIANLTLLPADQARLRNRVTVQPDSATVTIQDDDCKPLHVVLATQILHSSKFLQHLVVRMRTIVRVRTMPSN